ncbi:restriction endonuclease subunit S [Aliarcobacter skirrowii]|uniref:restriction endonuclease subunit S n=1 Tax=Aliarcobacter skirrowii TaxID=28200 RepID=UPI0029A9E356|nr:restriction endonuclease subunit S [Aliarcobacter skirrowii]MDX4060275.1 restriction endonuclease subunit S [Aliarcobacter skirrowii]
MSELYKLPDGWEWKKLDELTEVNIGKTPSRSKSEYFLGNKIWLSIRDLKSDYISDSNEKITDEAIKTSNMKVIPKGTLMMSFKLTLGKTAFADCDLYTNEAIASLPIKNENVIDKYFLKYSINVIDLEKEVDNAVKGKTLNKEKIKNLDIPLPPLEEQKRIVDKLDNLFAKIDKAIALHQKNIDEADIFMASFLNDVFAELKEKYGLNILSDSVANPKKDIVDGPFGSNLKATEYIDSGIPIIRLQNIQRFQFIEKDIKFVSEEKAQQLQRHTFISGDIVITKLGDPLGKSCIVPNFLENGIIVADVIRVRVDETKSNSRYINYSINSPISINQFSDSSTGATRQRVKLTMVRDLKIPLPPLPTQQKVVSYLDEISNKMEKIKQIQKDKMQSLKELKASILDKAFKGEL